jgi:hypothetical protein
MRKPDPSEFTPLPWYSWDSRPLTVPLDQDECATALYLDKGDIKAAAARLKVTVPRLNKSVRKDPRLQQLVTVLAAPE